MAFLKGILAKWAGTVQLKSQLNDHDFTYESVL